MNMDTIDLLAGSLKPFEKRSVSTYVMDLVMDHLLQGNLKPGDKLPTELEFAESLGVGRNSIREAIKMLSSLGVIEILRGEGTFVAREISAVSMNPLIMQLVFSKQTPQNLIELRMLLDSAIADLAVRKLQPGDIEKLELVNRKLSLEHEKTVPDQATLSRIDLEFHKTLAAITRNELVIKLGESIYTLFFASMQESLQGAPGGAYENHRLIIDAMATGDSNKVRKAVQDSLGHWRHRLAYPGKASATDAPPLLDKGAIPG